MNATMSLYNMICTHVFIHVVMRLCPDLLQVLSHRGSLWTLLQNTCHEMYTSVSRSAQLLGAIPSQVVEAAGDSPSGRGRGRQAVLYHCMARALCSGSVALMDMVLQLETRGMVNLRKEASAVSLYSTYILYIQMYSGTSL